MVKISADQDLRATINSLSMGIVILDKNLRVEFINDAYHAIWGSSNEELEPGTEFRYLINRNRDLDMQELSENEWEEYVDGRLEQIREGNLKHREFNRTDGRTLIFSITNLEGNRRLLSYFDVTAEKSQANVVMQAQQEAETIRQQLTEAIETLEDGFVFFDHEDKLVICNDAFRDQFKDAPNIDNMLELGTTYYDMTLQLAKSGIIPGIEGKEEQFVSDLVEKRTSELGLEKTFKTHDGRWIKQRDVRTESGGIVGVRIDVSDVKESEQEFSELNKLLSSITNTLPQGLLLLKDGKIVFFNPRLAELFGLLEDSDLVQIGAPFEDLLDHNLSRLAIEEKSEAKTFILERIRNHEAYTNIREFSNGMVGNVEGIPQEDGSYLYIYTDISSQRAAQREIEENQFLLQSTASSLPQGIMVLEKGKVKHFNPKMLELHELEDGQLFVGQDMRDFLSFHFANSYKGETTGDTGVVYDQIISGESYTVERETKCGKLLKIEGMPHDSGIYVYTYTDISEEKAAQLELAEREELLNSILSASENGVLVTNGFEEIITFNEQALDMLGFSSEDISEETTFKDLLKLQHENKFYALLEKTEIEFETYLAEAMRIAKSALSNPEIFHTTKGDSIRYSARELENGYLVHSYISITQEKQREDALETARNELTKTLDLQTRMSEAMAQGIIVFEDDKIVFFNNRAKDILGLPDSILFEGQSVDRFLEMQAEGGYFGPVSDGKEFVARHRTKIDSGTPYQIDRTTRDGKQLRVDGVPNSETNSLIITFTDITNLKERELEIEAARQEAEQLSEIQSASANAMVQGILFFQEKKLEFANPKFAELVGADPDKIHTGMHFKDVLEILSELGEFDDTTAKHAYKIEMEKNIDEQTSYQLIRKMQNGNILQIDAIARENNGLVVTYSDITESTERENDLKLAMKEAEAAERAKSEFLANMSHEIRTPMNGVMGMAELLATTELDSKQKMFTDVIVKSGSSLLTIINDILDFSKIDAGQLELDNAPFNLREAIEDVATLVSAKVAEKDLELIVRVDPALPNSLIGDVGRVRQIVTNLLGNAVKFTELGHIYLNVDGVADENGNVAVECSVEDTGIGIPEDKCRTIFQKFSQVDTSATRKHEGTGLGLSIASSLANLMGGSIRVESELGVGTKFTCNMTMGMDEEANTKAVVIPGDMTGAKILIVDDNEVNRSILTEQMAAWHFDSAAAESGAEGLQIMRAVKANSMTIDLVILDFQMPGMTGIDVLREMRNDPTLNDIPAIMLTSVDGVQSDPELRSLHLEASLTKPTRSSILLETSMQVIANSRASGQLALAKDALAEHANGEPAEQGDSPAGQAQKSKFEPASLDVLVAEDNEVNQIVFQQILEESGVNYKIVENGRLAVAAYKAHKPKMIIMDVSMPEMNGKDATAAIRSWERKEQMKRVPIVGVTAHALKGDMEACIEVGMDDYLSKPVSPQKLAIKVDQWLAYRKENAVETAKEL